MWRSQIYFDINKGRGDCIHDPIYSETYRRDETGVVGMDTDSIIYIHFYQFSLLSHSPNMMCRHGRQPF